MTVLTDTQVVTASGGLVELGYSQIVSGVTINNGTPGTGVEVVAPLTVVCDGSPILVEFFSPEARPYNAANYELNISLFEDGAEKIRSWGRQYNSAAGYDNKPVALSTRLTPSAGSHTYGVKAYVTNTSPSTNTGRVEAGSGTTGSAPAFLRVSKIVQATQWPAVTTGTIICTSSTRPASPFAGQQIYETDTSLSYTYSGSAWVQTGNLGAWTTFVPTLTQSGTVTKADAYCRYSRVGRTITASANVSVTGAGTGGIGVSFGLPVAATSSLAHGSRIGIFHIYDASTATRYAGHAEINSASTVSCVTDVTTNNIWGAVPSIALASTDQLSFTVTYEAAA